MAEGSHPEQVARTWINAFNRKDLEFLLSLYHSDAVHLSPRLRARRRETNGKIQGQMALRQWWAEAFTRLPTLNYELKQLTANDSRVFMEYVRCVEGEEDSMIAEVLEIREGRIAASRAYQG